MQFASFTFLFLFFPLSLSLYYFVPFHWKKRVMFVTNLFFVVCGGFAAAVIEILLTLGTYGIGWFIFRLRERKLIRKAVLFGIIMVYILLLIFLRSDMMHQFENSLLHGIQLFPLGFAFFSLSGIAYCIDIERGKEKPERNFLHFANYMLFYPKLIMGPFISYASMRKCRLTNRFSAELVGKGIVRFVIGLSKKLLLADWIGLLFQTINQTDPSVYSLFVVWIGAFSQLVTLFLEFSGYADMAIGLGMCYGFQLPESYGKSVFFYSISRFADQWNRTVVQWFSHYIGTHFHGNNRFFHLFAVTATWGCIGLWYGFHFSSLIFGLSIGIFIWMEYTLLKQNHSIKLHYVITVLILSVEAMLLSQTDWSSSWSYLQAMFRISHIAPVEIDGIILRQVILILLVSIYVSSGNWKTVLKRIETISWVSAIRIPVMICLTFVLVFMNMVMLIFHHGNICTNLLL